MFVFAGFSPITVGPAIRQITSDKVCLLTPKAGVIPPMMTVLMSFQREVWMMTAITCVLVTVIYFAAAALDTHRPGPTGSDLGLEIYRMFIGAPTNRIFALSCRRILTSFCLFFTLVILNAFQVPNYMLTQYRPIDYYFAYPFVIYIIRLLIILTYIFAH